MLALCVLPAVVDTAVVTVRVGYFQEFHAHDAAIASGYYDTDEYQFQFFQLSQGIRAMSALDNNRLDITEAGSSPFALGVARGINATLLSLVAMKGDASGGTEGIVVRSKGNSSSGIAATLAPQDLSGKTVGVPFGSTAHYNTLFFLEQVRLPFAQYRDADAASAEKAADAAAGRVQLLHLAPTELAVDFHAEAIDAAAVWEPHFSTVLEQRHANVLLYSGTMTDWGASTFVGMAAMRPFAEQHPRAVRRVLKVMELLRADYAAAKAQAALDGQRRGPPPTYSDWSKNSTLVAAVNQVDSPTADAADAFATIGADPKPSVTEMLSCRRFNVSAACGAVGGLRETLAQHVNFHYTQKNLARTVTASGSNATWNEAARWMDSMATLEAVQDDRTTLATLRDSADTSRFGAVNPAKGNGTKPNCANQTTHTTEAGEIVLSYMVSGAEKLECDWVVAPTNSAAGLPVLLRLNWLALEPGYDFLRVYETSSGKLLGSFTGGYEARYDGGADAGGGNVMAATLPAVRGTPPLRLAWSSDGISNDPFRLSLAQGFNVSWELAACTSDSACGDGVCDDSTGACVCHNGSYGAFCAAPSPNGMVDCLGTSTLEGTEGTLSATHGNSADCRWIVAPAAEGAGAVELDFSSFSLETGVDFLDVHDGATDGACTGRPLWRFTGETLPPRVVHTGPLVLRLRADPMVAGGHFTLQYNANAEAESCALCSSNGTERCDNGICMCREGYFGVLCTAQQCQPRAVITGVNNTLATSASGVAYPNYPGGIDGARDAATLVPTCSWRIEPGNNSESKMPHKVELRFERFDLETGVDYLLIDSGSGRNITFADSDGTCVDDGDCGPQGECVDTNSGKTCSCGSTEPRKVGANCQHDAVFEVELNGAEPALEVHFYSDANGNTRQGVQLQYEADYRCATWGPREQACGGTEFGKCLLGGQCQCKDFARQFEEKDQRCDAPRASKFEGADCSEHFLSGYCPPGFVRVWSNTTWLAAATKDGVFDPSPASHAMAFKCAACPSGRFQLGPLAERTVHAVSPVAGDACFPCPDGAECERDSVKLKSGFAPAWRNVAIHDEQTLQVVRCQAFGTTCCPGGGCEVEFLPDPARFGAMTLAKAARGRQANTTDRAYVNGNATAYLSLMDPCGIGKGLYGEAAVANETALHPPCKSGRTGLLCARCVNGGVNWLGKCNTCDQATNHSHVAMLICLMLLWGLYLCLTKEGLDSRVQIAVDYVQVAALVVNPFRVNVVQEDLGGNFAFRKYMDILSMRLDSVEVESNSCFFSGFGDGTRFATAYFLPVSCLVVILAIALWFVAGMALRHLMLWLRHRRDGVLPTKDELQKERRCRRMAANQMTGAVWRFFYYSTITIILSAFDSVACRDVGTVQVLKRYPEVVCGTPVHARLETTAFLVAVVWTVIIPTLVTRYFWTFGYRHSPPTIIQGVVVERRRENESEGEDDGRSFDVLHLSTRALLTSDGKVAPSRTAQRTTGMAAGPPRKRLKKPPARQNANTAIARQSTRLSLSNARVLFDSIIKSMEEEGAEAELGSADTEEHDLDAQVQKVLAARGAGHLVQFIKYRKGARLWIVLYQIGWRILLSLIATFVYQESSKQALMLVVIGLLFMVQIWQRPYERAQDNMLSSVFFVLLLAMAAIEFLFAGYQEGLVAFAQFEPSINAQFYTLAYVQQALVVLPLPFVVLKLGIEGMPEVCRQAREHHLTAFLLGKAKKRLGSTRLSENFAPKAEIAASETASALAPEGQSNTMARPASMRFSLNPLNEDSETVQRTLRTAKDPAASIPSTGSMLTARDAPRHRSDAENPTTVM